ncbi:unnamed protein product, partial [Linum tenue]
MRWAEDSELLKCFMLCGFCNKADFPGFCFDSEGNVYYGLKFKKNIY